MVLLYIEKTKADETLWFKNHINKSNKISLISCSFYNLLFNLISEGTISGSNGDVLLRIPIGKYTITSFKDAVDKAIYIGKKPVSIKFENNKAFFIPTVNVTLNETLSYLLNITTKSLEAKTKHEIKIKQPPTAIYIHCDLIKSSQVLLETNYSQILACVVLDRVGYRVFYAPYNLLFSSINENDYISSIRLWVTDSKGTLINTGIYPMNLTIELT